MEVVKTLIDRTRAHRLVGKELAVPPHSTDARDAQSVGGNFKVNVIKVVLVASLCSMTAHRTR